MLSNVQVLATGGTGIIGLHVVRMLLAGKKLVMMNRTPVDFRGNDLL